MRITVNGDVRDLPPGTTLASLLDDLGLVVGSVVVEHNGTALLKAEVAGLSLQDGDVLELVRAVAGG